jgi:hypothetical protein
MSPTKEQRAMMADLCSRAAHVFHCGDDDMLPGAGEAARVAANMRNNDDREGRYRCGLKWLQVPSPDIDAAVAAIARGEHPPDSLPGRVKKMHADAKERADRPNQASEDDYFAMGEESAAAHVLDLLGCKVTP